MGRRTWFMISWVACSYVRDVGAESWAFFPFFCSQLCNQNSLYTMVRLSISFPLLPPKKKLNSILEEFIVGCKKNKVEIRQPGELGRTHNSVEAEEWKQLLGSETLLNIRKAYIIRSYILSFLQTIHGIHHLTVFLLLLCGWGGVLNFFPAFA